jgi:hypothetical protein
MDEIPVNQDPSLVILGLAVSAYIGMAFSFIEYVPFLNKQSAMVKRALIVLGAAGIASLAQYLGYPALHSFTALVLASIAPHFANEAVKHIPGGTKLKRKRPDGSDYSTSEEEIKSLGIDR